MITPELYQVFDWSEGSRRLHYGRLKNVKAMMADLVRKVRQGNSDQFIDLGLCDKRGEFWMPLTRPGMPTRESGAIRHDLTLLDYIGDWAIGVQHQATCEMLEMDDRYPELAKLELTRLMPADMIYRGQPRPNRLRRAFKRIFRR